MRMNAAGASGDPAPLPPKVLIVEDDVLIRAATAQFLRGTGFTVLEAVDADQELERQLRRLLPQTDRDETS